MIEEAGGQLTFSDQDFSFGKTSPEPSVPTKGKISRKSSRKSSESRSQKPPMCLCLVKDGPGQDSSTMKWVDGQLLGDYMMPSTGEQPNTLMEECTPGEHLNGVSESQLSLILEDSPPQKYYLSAKACNGILNRAQKRNKPIPEPMLTALQNTSRLMPEATSEIGGCSTPTITGDHQNRITDYTALCINGKVPGTFDSSYWKGCGTRNGEERPFISQGPTVRRFTPVEIERLFGYPDKWTDIGDWTDSAGKVHKLTDSHRYRALGNSIALPFWFWLLRRISAQYERPATLGSLFSGLGGFELCWEKCNGPGTAVFASEIDEYCIAVTNYHFNLQKDYLYG